MPRKHVKLPEPSPDGDGHLELVQHAGIQEMLQVSRQRVSQLVREKGFPEPYGRLPTGSVWLRSDIEKWYGENKARFRTPAKTYVRKRR